MSGLTWRKLGRRVFPLLLAFLPLIATSTTASGAEKKILILYSDKSNGLMISYREALQSTVRAGSPDRITFYEEYMDLWQFSGDDYLSLLHGFYRQKYQGQRFDLIIAEAPDVLSFLLKYGDDLFPGTPVVFGNGEKTWVGGLKLTPNVTGVLRDLHFAPTLDAALRMQPDTRRVVVVAGTSEDDVRFLNKARTEFRSFDGRVEFTYLTDLPMAELENRLARLPERTITFYVCFYRDGAGQAFILMDSMARVAKASTVPTYSVVDRFIDAGSIGGFVFSVEADATETAKIALRVLSGEKPADIPIQITNTNRYMFNWRQLERWGIDEQRLPAGSIVRFKEPSAWEQYKWRIVAVICLFLLEAWLILWLSINHMRRRRAEAETARFAGRLLTLQDEERRRVAGELHDGLGQSLAIIKNRAKLGLREETNQQRVKEQFEQIATTATSAILEVREIAHNLRPYELDRLGLVAAIESMIERVSSSTSINLSADLERIEGLLSPESETSVYRIVQEGLNNVVRHSHATEARIEIMKRGKELTISVRDNGRGIRSPSSVGNGNNAGGFGLVGIAERVRALGGSLAIDSQPRRGTTLTIRLESPGVTAA